MGRPSARERRRKTLLITADGGGSNGYRLRQWKLELQRFGDGLEFLQNQFSMSAEPQRQRTTDYNEQLQHASIVAGAGAKIIRDEFWRGSGSGGAKPPGVVRSRLQ